MQVVQMAESFMDMLLSCFHSGGHSEVLALKYVSSVSGCHIDWSQRNDHETQGRKQRQDPDLAQKRT
jgi:hypothetical protein